MNPLVSWGIFISAIGLWWFFARQRPAAAAAAKARAASAATDISSLTKKDLKPEPKKPEPKKAKKKKPAAAPAAQKPAAPPTPVVESDAASSTGGDADMDEYASSDPMSDMLERPSSGAGVLRITPSAQPPRAPKTRKQPSTEAPGLHAAKNAKKKEKKKAVADASKAEQRQRLEAHRAASREAAAAAPATAAPQSNSWSKPPAIPVAPQQKKEVELLDTFDAAPIGGWEDVPSHIAAGETSEWNEVKRKGRAGGNKTATPPRVDTPPPAPKVAPVVIAKPVPTHGVAGKKGKKSAVMAQESATSGSDWSRVEDDPDAWAVHPESD